MKEIDAKIFEYFKISGKGDNKEITVPFLDTFLIIKFHEKEYIGGKLLERISYLINEQYIIKTTGSKIALTSKGIKHLK